MNSRRYFWQLAFATALWLALTLLASLWFATHALQTGEMIAALAVFAGVTLVLLLAYADIRRCADVMGRITHAARRLSSGDLSVKLETGGSRELELLARAVNQTRQRLAAQVESMDRQRRTFEAMLTQLREGVVVVGSDGRIVLMNPSAVRLLNLPEPRDGRGFAGLAVERCIPQLELQRLLAARAPRGESESAAGGPRGLWETRVQIDAPASVLHLLAQVAEIVLPDGPVGQTGPSIGRLLVLTDITDLTRNIQMKTDFVANASHELRTPLSTIRAAVETLHNLDFHSDADAATRFVEVIDRQSARLEALASDLLDLSRVETGATRFVPRSLSVSELLSQLQTQLAEHLTRRGVRLEIDTSGYPRATVQANPQLLRLVLDNVLDNAIKFSEAGDAVRLVCRSDEESLTFEVIDQGCGISPEDQERVFERFYQVERARSGPAADRGTGLGLSIVRHAVNAMEGEVSLRSRLGEGTSVTVTIPQLARAAGQG